jgi:hypothetical protein
MADEPHFLDDLIDPFVVEVTGLADWMNKHQTRYRLFARENGGRYNLTGYYVYVGESTDIPGTRLGWVERAKNYDVTPPVECWAVRLVAAESYYATFPTLEEAADQIVAIHQEGELG